MINLVGSSYDAIIVGGGHNGLLLGAYLAKSGMSVVVFEKQYEVGGGLCTMEFTRSGLPEIISVQLLTLCF